MDTYLGFNADRWMCSSDVFHVHDTMSAGAYCGGKYDWNDEELQDPHYYDALRQYHDANHYNLEENCSQMNVVHSVLSPTKNSIKKCGRRNTSCLSFPTNNYKQCNTQASYIQNKYQCFNYVVKPNNIACYHGKTSKCCCSGTQKCPPTKSESTKCCKKEVKICAPPKCERKEAKPSPCGSADTKKECPKDFPELIATVSHVKIGPTTPCPDGRKPCIGPKCLESFAPSNGFVPVNVRTGASNPRKGVFEIIIRRITGAPLAKNELILEWTPPPTACASPSACGIKPCRPKCRMIM